MLRRIIFCVSLAGVTTAAFASFEMMLLPQSTGRVLRYDPVNQVSLGSFQSLPTAAGMVTIDPTTSTAFSASSTAVRSTNYDNGIHNWFASAGVRAIAFDTFGGVNLFALSSNAVTRFNSQGNNVSGVSLPTSATWDSMAMSGQYLNIFGRDSSNNVKAIQVNTLTNTATSVFDFGRVALPGTTIGGMATFISPQNGFHYSVAAFINASGNIEILRALKSVQDWSTTPIFGSQTISTGFSNAVVPAATPSHDGFYLVGHDSTTSTTLRFRQFNSIGSFTAVNEFTLAAFGAAGVPFFQVANIVAPEPGSMLAVGLGALMLLRRRSR